jgi:haloacetate dehalogenase
MRELPELFPGYESGLVKTGAGKIFVRWGGDGSPVLLLHGYPQTSVMWHRLAPLLAGRHRLIMPDLPGYGLSDAPDSQPDHSPYTKRAMAQAMVEVMDNLGHERFAVVGHDRGGRVGYRLALDHPERIKRLSVLDIIPTWEMWATMNARRAMKVFHWSFLAQPHPLPELLIGKAPVQYLEWKMSSWNGADGLSVFDPRALEHYRAFFAVPARLHATCEDYRAGQSTDVTIDEADVEAGRKIECPVLALWGTRGIPSDGEDPLAVWRRWARQVEGRAIESGHFLAEENPGDTAAALLAFLDAKKVADG